MSFGRRLMTVAVALLLAAVTAMPLLAEARHAASGPVALAMTSVTGQDPANAHQDADDLVHHAQGVMPVAAKAPASVATLAARSFARPDDVFRAGGGAQRPFEPPRA